MNDTLSAATKAKKEAAAQVSNVLNDFIQKHPLGDISLNLTALHGDNGRINAVFVDVFADFI